MVELTPGCDSIAPVIEAGSLFRCVCGSDIPLRDGQEITCPACGRRHKPQAMRQALLETVVLEKGEAVARAAAAAAERPSLTGQSLDHFKVLEKLGQGGVGTVYRALDTSLERYVALKVLNEEGDPQALEAFVHEARAQARLNHPGIATIYYIGRRGDIPYFAMEYVPGEGLDARVERGPLPAGEVIRTGLQAVRALREANSHGITHRDIKPGNFIRSRTGQIKLTDFGLAKTERGGLHLTGERSITGTPYYIAPEQARGESTDLRADIYSLGAMLYHLAYGKPPFEAENFVSVISRHLGSPLEFPAEPPPDIPAGFAEVVSRMMAKDPAGRFQDYDALEAALRQLLPEWQVMATLYRRGLTMAIEWALKVAVVALVLGAYALLAVVLSQSDKSPPIVLETAVAAVLLGSFVIQLLNGRSPGKQFSRLRIASIHGGASTLRMLALRWLLQWVIWVALLVSLVLADVALPWAPVASKGVLIIAAGFFLVDHLWALTNRRRRTLHDVLSGTWVLEDRPDGESS